MGFAGGFDDELRIALWIGLAAFVLTLAILLQVILLRRLLRRSLLAREAFIQRWRPPMMAATLGDTVVPPPLAARDRIKFLVLWNEYRESVRGEAETGLNRLALAVGADETARRLLDEGNGGERLLALLTLGRLGNPADCPRLLQAAKMADPYVSIAAARALVQVDPMRAVHDLLPLVARRDDWPPAKVVSIIGGAGADVLSPVLVRLLRRVPAAALPRLLPLLGAIHVETAAPILDRVLARASKPELIISALKLVRAPGSIVAVRGFLGNEDWRVRAQAASAIGRIGSWRDMERLVPLLQDREWWVRYRAAQAVVRLPGVNTGDLRALHARLQDPFARDMLVHAASELGPVPIFATAATA